MIRLNKVNKIYGKDEALTVALSDINLNINTGEMVAIMGPSGSGKSTLLNILGTVDSPTSGDYFFEGENITGYSDSQKAEYRNKKIGFVFQDFAIIPRYTALENVELPLRFANISSRKRHEAALDILEKVGLHDKQNSLPEELSGGQKQRIAIARAIVNDAKLLLCDEPTGALDRGTTTEIMNLFCELNNSGRTLVIVTHDSYVADFCSRIITIEDGKIKNDAIKQTSIAVFN